MLVCLSLVNYTNLSTLQILYLLDLLFEETFEL